MNNEPQRIALLWDIDGTLLDTNGVAAKQLIESFKEITREDCSIYPGQFSGFTDFEIVLTLLANSGLHPEIDRAEQILTHYGTRLKNKLLETPPTLLAEVREVFQNMEKLTFVQHFIGTGNSKLGAHTKIATSGLQKYFEDDSYFISTPEKVSRDLVIESAANAIYYPTLLIGDSDRDIMSAKKNKLTVLAVATGHHKVDELKSHNPDYILSKNWTAEEFFDVIRSYYRKVYC